MAELARRTAVTACLLLALPVSASCSSAGVKACQVEATLTQLCVVNGDGGIAIDRLAATNFADPSHDILPNPENPQDSLVDVHVEKDTPLTVAIGPSEGLALVEIDIYSSQNGLDDAAPVLSVECEDSGCNRWSRSQTRNGQAIQIPSADLESGYVVVVQAFVNRVNESGTVSWGLLIVDN